ncbi:MAG: SIS domain-containing protein [Sphaerochaeta sp.]|uniref:SIS domain-containing protein n=1 Tax=bioreactor metagenome TaxID=1076179 RepID=A0A644WAK7_9ZZZZ|nr:SIS domain-containing protein [Sphaerochaeta sp.]
MALDTEIARNQLVSLPELYSETFSIIDRSIRNTLTASDLVGVKQVIIVGNGDSYFAGLASIQTFQKYSAVSYKVVQSMRFFAYEHAFIKEYSPGQTVIVGVSASGESRRVVQALSQARKNLPTAKIYALVGNPESSVARVADKIIDVSIANKGTAPGIRSYTASLFGLLGLALRFGELQGKIHLHDANAIRSYIPTLAPIVEIAVNESLKIADKISSLPLRTVFTVVGSGNNYGTALFNAAKFVEIAGLNATGQDLEEWLHVERFAYPLDSTVLVIAPSGNGFDHAKKLMKVAKTIGHHLICITDVIEDAFIKETADICIPLDMGKEELFSNLIAYIPSVPFAIAYASKLQRKMFMSDNTSIFEERQALSKRLKEEM